MKIHLHIKMKSRHSGHRETRFLLRPGRSAEYCDQPVCLSVCEQISGTPRLIFTKFCAQMPCGGRGSVLLWRRCDTLCTSGFIDDVTFDRKRRAGETWRLDRTVTAMSCVAIPGPSLMSMNGCLILWPSPSWDYLDIRTWRRYSEDAAEQRKEVFRSRLSKVESKQDRHT